LIEQEAKNIDLISSVLLRFGVYSFRLLLNTNTLCTPQRAPAIGAAQNARANSRKGNSRREA